MQSIHAIEYYSALRRKEILTPVTRWINLEDVVLREISQSPILYIFHVCEEYIHGILPVYSMYSMNLRYSGRVRFMELESRMVVSMSGAGEGWGWGKRNGKLMFSGYRVSAWDDEKVWTWTMVESCTTV